MKPYAERAPRTTRWEHYEHGADIGVRGFGGTKAEAFEQAGLALTAVVCDLRGVGQHHEFDPHRVRRNATGTAIRAGA